MSRPPMTGPPALLPDDLVVPEKFVPLGPPSELGVRRQAVLDLGPHLTCLLVGTATPGVRDFGRHGGGLTCGWCVLHSEVDTMWPDHVMLGHDVLLTVRDQPVL